MSSGGMPSSTAASAASGTTGTTTVSSRSSGTTTTVTRTLIATPSCHLSLSRETTQDKIQVISGTPLNGK